MKKNIKITLSEMKVKSFTTTATSQVKGGYMPTLIHKVSCGPYFCDEL